MKFPALQRSSSLFFACLVLALAVVRGDARAAWPPPPGADMRDKANWPNDYDAPWGYLSFLPDGAGALDPADLALGASGMSVDRAWTLTVGKPEILIGILDSGIEWDNADLVNKAYLNRGELAGDKRPRTATGSACPGDGYDCNGDGVFSVADYRDDPRIAPVQIGEKCFQQHDPEKPGADRILGDVNRNCVLDAGDLIALFSDAVDDDGNGYKDDVSGWDFFANDNDPYDDTRFGHGTSEGHDSVSEANNGAGQPGICPGCRFVPLRVGDSFVTEANDFAKAVVYSADNGVKVVQEALGTLDQTPFSKAAIDYAYRRGVLVVASMADENARHHNMPATANHVLTVHTIRHDGDRAKGSSTFIAFDTCSNYGGHLSLSVSGTGCSSEATGRAAGIAGLLYSMALSEGVTLSAEEAIQLFKMEADDIDVASSRVDPASAKHYFSQRGFDQRFGYGRANALRMLEAVRARRIPPEVDIVSPEWFAPFHADRAKGPIAITGRVAAKRARTYDLRVEWAPGVQPAESDYRELAAPLLNVPGATVTGNTPLAQIDPNAIDTAHVPDPDSPMNENARSISIRVRAVAHYDGFDVPGEARRVIAITNDSNGGRDADLLPGFPLDLGASAEAASKMADVDGDGVRDLIVPDSAGRLHVFALTPSGPREVSGFPYVTRPIDGLSTEIPTYLNGIAYVADGIDPSIAREAILQAPAIGDLDGDGKPEIVFATWPGTIYAIDRAGKDLPGFPKRLPLVPSCPADPTKPKPERCTTLNQAYARGTYSAPVLADMNRDGRPEIVLSAFDGRIHVFRADGSPLDGFPVDLASPRSKKVSRIMATPSVGDLNGDGIPEIVCGSNQLIGGGDGAGPVFVVDGRGNAAPGGPYLPNWPITMTSLKLFPVVAEGIFASPALADFDGDGIADVVAQGNGSRPLVLKADPGPQENFEEPPNRLPITTTNEGEQQRGLDATSIFGEASRAHSPDVMFPLFSHPSVGDLDMDGVPDVIVTGGSLSLASALAGGGRRPTGPQQQLLAMWSGKTGRMLPGSPMVIEDYTFLLNHAVADVSGDGFPEVVTGSGGYFLHAADGCGREPAGWPKFTNGWIAATPSVGDVDGDGALEVVTSTRTGWLFAWKTTGKADGVVQWESFHHDNANTGNVATKLAQGGVTRASSPLECSAPASIEEEKAGCGCSTVSSRSSGGGLLAMVAAVAFFLRRRRFLAVVAAVVLVPSCSADEQREEEAFGEPGCDNLDESACLFPFPSDHFRKPGGPNGQAHHIDFADKLPVSSRTEQRVSSEPFKVHDGYPVVPAITFSLRGATTTGAPSLDDIAMSERPESKTLIIDTVTGARVPHWVELDYLAENAGERILQIRVANALEHDRRYVVAVRGLVDDAGATLPPTRGFASLRDGKPTKGAGLEERRTHFVMDVFPVLERAGVARGDLQLAWDFTTTTFAGSTSRLLTMRDRLYDLIGDQGPEYTVTNVVTDPGGPDGPIAKIVEGVAKVPSFVLPQQGVAQPRRLRLDAHGLPTSDGFEEVKFRVQVPRIALSSTRKMAVMQYGHGFLGDDTEANGSWLRQWANRHGFLILSSNMQGMDVTAGVAWYLRLPEDAANTSHVAEEPLQGLMNHLALQRLMKGRFLADPNVLRAGAPLYDPERLYYHGNSQGGTMGNLVVVPSRDVKRAMLGVPGVAIGFLLMRASQWEERSSLLKDSYTDVFGFATLMCLVQLGWDKTDAINFAPHHSDLPGTPPHQIMLQAALEDSQVNIDVSRLLARLYDAKLVTPAPRPVYGLAAGRPPFAGANAYVEVDYGVPARAKTNRPSNSETDTHEFPRRQIPMQDQAWHFLETGEVIATCSGACDPD